jgi:hypothetical protein
MTGQERHRRNVGGMLFGLMIMLLGGKNFGGFVANNSP